MRPAAAALSFLLAAAPAARAQSHEEASQDAARSFHDPSGKGAVGVTASVAGRHGLKAPPAFSTPAAKPRIGAEVSEIGGRVIENRSAEAARVGALAGALIGGAAAAVLSAGNPAAAAIGWTAGGVVGGAALGWVAGKLWGTASYRGQVNDAIYEQHESLGQKVFGDPFPRK